MLTYPSNYASYPVPAWFILSLDEGSVQTFVDSLTSLLRSPLTSLRLINASERYLSALGTFTRWDILVKELYLPFKAHTSHMFYA
ncbi:hypothetical protein ACFQ0R_05800 [Psychroflexus salinarum]|uniref:Uncharacterized protein n=1 Tax=Psychroflexus salinarum TaxID=546024 RepID=A0ABW3GNU4_9FLAO